MVQPGTTLVVQVGSVQGPPGPPGPPSVISGVNNLLAGENIPAGRFVYSAIDGKIYIADSSNVAHIGKVIGVTSSAVLANSLVNVITSGTASISGLIEGLTYFLSLGGGLTYIPPTVGFVQKVGVSVDTGTLDVILGPPVKV
jgi:hypothetical protein